MPSEAELNNPLCPAARKLLERANELIQQAHAIAPELVPKSTFPREPYGWVWEWADGQHRFLAGTLCAGEDWIPLYR